MGRHEHPGIARRPRFRHEPRHPGQEILPIGVILEDVRALDPPGHDVVHHSGRRFRTQCGRPSTGPLLPVKTRLPSSPGLYVAPWRRRRATFVIIGRPALGLGDPFLAWQRPLRWWNIFPQRVDQPHSVRWSQCSGSVQNVVESWHLQPPRLPENENDQVAATQYPVAYA